MNLAHEGLRMARVLSGLVPDEPEVHGLLALLELTAAGSLRGPTPPELLTRLGHVDEAKSELRLGLERCSNDRERIVLSGKLAALGGSR